MMILIPDTHTLIWYLSDDPKLGRKARVALSRREGIEIVIPIIVLFEISYLQKRKSLPVSLADIRHWIAGNSHVRVHPIDISILDGAPLNLEIHDAIIVGTALTLSGADGNEVHVVSVDAEINACKNINIIW